MVVAHCLTSWILDCLSKADSLLSCSDGCRIVTRKRGVPGLAQGYLNPPPIVAQDVFYGNDWHTMLVGGLRSGGQGYYALDITDPTDTAADVVNWEFSDRNDADMGYTYGRAQLVKANNGKWVVIVPNGYNSTVNDGRVGSGKAVLFVLDAEDGSVLAKFEVGSGTTSDPSGLSSPVAVSDNDVNHFAEKASGTDPDDFTVDYVYAGDLHGNLWKFDMSSANPADWDDAYKLYAAGSNQPITGRPAIGTTIKSGTASGNQDIRYVYFGTGQYIEPDDVNSTANQEFFGLIDDDTCTSSGTACIGSGDLVAQTIGGDGRVSDNQVGAGDKGWSLSLTAGAGAAERVIGRPFVLGSVVLFASIVPEGDACSAGGDSFLYALDRFNGGMTDFQVLDINSDGVITSSDYGDSDTIARKELPQLTGGEFAALDGADAASAAAVAYSGKDPTIVNPFDRIGRVRWRQIK